MELKSEFGKDRQHTVPAAAFPSPEYPSAAQQFFAKPLVYPALAAR
jgi:hypothetical protein